ncbi:MAG: hypothetical protein NTZ19_01765 [Bacteroidetes bacterium]|nr:hypothetical protein [Bacteroidota bacterium]
MPFLSNFFNLGFIQVSNAAIQIILFPLIIHVVGLGNFGLVMVANSLASIGALIVNYGTGLSGIKDVTVHKNNPSELSTTVYNIFFTRIILAILCLLAVPLLYFAHYDLLFLLPALPILLSEIVNPLFFFTGIEKLLLYNLANLLAKLMAAACILLTIKTQANAPWVNFYLGIFNLFFYLVLAVYTLKKYQLGKIIFKLTEIYALLKNNFYLAGNNFSVQLQQSFFLFAIATTHNPLLLGAYSLCDKVVWSFRLLLTAFSGAVFPKAVRLYQEDATQWYRYKKNTNQWLAIFFLLVGIGLFVLSPFITKILTGGDNALSTSFIRSISFVPFVSSMNLLNVLDLLIKNSYQTIFKIAMLLLAISICTSLLLITFGAPAYFGSYPLIIEISSFSLYFYFIKKSGGIFLRGGIKKGAKK